MVPKKGCNVAALIGAILIIVLIGGACASSVGAATAADFYKGKKFTFIVASKAGGGTDSITRIIAPYLQKYTGAYAVVVDNVPEGGGVVALNRLWNSKPDGLTICTSIGSDTVIMEVSKQEGVQFQGNKMSMIFALTTERGSVLMVSATGRFQSLEDLMKAKGLKSGGATGKAMQAAYFTDLLGLDAKITHGMSAADTRMAVMRGEIDFNCDSPGGAIDAIKSGEMKAVCVDLPTTIPGLSQVPSITKFAKLSTQQKGWSKIFELYDQGKYVSIGPKVPKDRIEYLRSVFDRIHKDPDFRRDRKRFERRPGGEPWLNGAEAQQMFIGFSEQATKGYIQMVDYLGRKYYTVK